MNQRPIKPPLDSTSTTSTLINTVIIILDTHIVSVRHQQETNLSIFRNDNNNSCTLTDNSSHFNSRSLPSTQLHSVIYY